MKRMVLALIGDIICWTLLTVAMFGFGWNIAGALIGAFALIYNGKNALFLIRLKRAYDTLLELQEQGEDIEQILQDEIDHRREEANEKRNKNDRS